MKRAVLVVALMLAGASAAVAQDARPVVDPRLSTLDQSVQPSISAIIDSARSAGLPAEPLIDKALEGASKRASPDRIVLAVRNLATDLRTARRALGADAREQELVAGVGALRAGAGEEVLRRLKAARGAESTLLPLVVLSDLVAQGTPVDRAAAAVIRLAERGATEAQFRELPGSQGRGQDKATVGRPGSVDRGNRGSEQTGRGRPAATGRGSGAAIPPNRATRGDDIGPGSVTTPEGPGTPVQAPVVPDPAAEAPRPSPPRAAPVAPAERGRTSVLR